MSRARLIAWMLVLSFAVSAWWLGGVGDALEGTVADDAGPIANARVGWQGQTRRVSTDAGGRFRLPLGPRGKRLIATKPGYRIASGPPFSLRLERLPADDHSEYEWIDPHPDPRRANNCANCHGDIYREWQGSAHARAAMNPKFLQLYAGPHQTWNARAEYPDGAAVCATCHAPTLTSPTLEYDVREAGGVAKSGVHCDYCHKVADVPSGKFGTRFGRDALYLLRPAKGDLLTFGPLDDAVRPGESFAYSPLYKDSRYCASCHEGTVFGVHAYSTYSEWLDSPAKAQGKQCQHCHMAPTGKLTNIAPGKGGVARNPMTLASHGTPGGQLDMLKRCLTLEARVVGTSVEVTVAASNVGHRVPTGFVDRHLLLLVEAVDEDGVPVALTEGPRLPKSAGKWAGAAGALFAKQLTGDTGRTPIPFWLHVANVDDTRLVPERVERRAFVFADRVRRATVQLWYRRFWQEVADARGWVDNDVLVHEATIDLHSISRKGAKAQRRQSGGD